MALLAKLNTDRCRMVARDKDITLSEAGDFLVELGWCAYRDHLDDQMHPTGGKLDRELRKIHKQRNEVLHRKVNSAKRSVAA